MSRDEFMKRVIAMIQHRTVDQDQQQLSESELLEYFVCTHVQNCSLETFLCRVNKYSKICPLVLVYALILLDRATIGYTGSTKKNNIELRLNEFNKFNLLGLMIVLSIKMLHDQIHSNSIYARIMGIKSSTFNDFELTMCIRMGFYFHVDCEEFLVYCGVNFNTNVLAQPESKTRAELPIEHETFKNVCRCCSTMHRCVKQ